MENVTMFAFGGVGFVGVISTGEKEFHRIASDESHAKSIWLDLLAANTTPLAARLYALCGLRALGACAKSEFECYANVLRTEEVVTTMRGCVGGVLVAREVVERIETGYYDCYLFKKPATNASVPPPLRDEATDWFSQARRRRRQAASSINAAPPQRFDIPADLRPPAREEQKKEPRPVLQEYDRAMESRLVEALERFDWSVFDNLTAPPEGKRFDELDRDTRDRLMHNMAVDSMRIIRQWLLALKRPESDLDQFYRMADLQLADWMLLTSLRETGPELRRPRIAELIERNLLIDELLFREFIQLEPAANDEAHRTNFADGVADVYYLIVDQIARNTHKMADAAGERLNSAVFDKLARERAECRGKMAAAAAAAATFESGPEASVSGEFTVDAPPPECLPGQIRLTDDTCIESEQAAEERDLAIYNAAKLIAPSLRGRDDVSIAQGMFQDLVRAHADFSDDTIRHVFRTYKKTIPRDRKMFSIMTHLKEVIRLHPKGADWAAYAREHAAKFSGWAFGTLRLPPSLVVESETSSEKKAPKPTKTPVRARSRGRARQDPDRLQEYAEQQTIQLNAFAMGTTQRTLSPARSAAALAADPNYEEPSPSESYQEPSLPVQEGFFADIPGVTNPRYGYTASVAHRMELHFNAADERYSTLLDRAQQMSKPSDQRLALEEAVREQNWIAYRNAAIGLAWESASTYMSHQVVMSTARKLYGGFSMINDFAKRITRAADYANRLAARGDITIDVQNLSESETLEKFKEMQHSARYISSKVREMFVGERLTALRDSLDVGIDSIKSHLEEAKARVRSELNNASSVATPEDQERLENILTYVVDNFSDHIVGLADNWSKLKAEETAGFKHLVETLDVFQKEIDTAVTAAFTEQVQALLKTSALAADAHEFFAREMSDIMDKMLNVNEYSLETIEAWRWVQSLPTPTFLGVPLVPLRADNLLRMFGSERFLEHYMQPLIEFNHHVILQNLAAAEKVINLGAKENRLPVRFVDSAIVEMMDGQQVRDTFVIKYPTLDRAERAPSMIQNMLGIVSTFVEEFKKRYTQQTSEGLRPRVTLRYGDYDWRNGILVADLLTKMGDVRKNIQKANEAVIGRRSSATLYQYLVENRSAMVPNTMGGAIPALVAYNTGNHVMTFLYSLLRFLPGVAGRAAMSAGERGLVRRVQQLARRNDFLRELGLGKMEKFRGFELLDQQLIAAQRLGLDGDRIREALSGAPDVQVLNMSRLIDDSSRAGTQLSAAQTWRQMFMSAFSRDSFEDLFGITPAAASQSGRLRTVGSLAYRAGAGALSGYFTANSLVNMFGAGALVWEAFFMETAQGVSSAEFGAPIEVARSAFASLVGSALLLPAVDWMGLWCLQLAAQRTTATGNDRVGILRLVAERAIGDLTGGVPMRMMEQYAQTMVNLSNEYGPLALQMMLMQPSNSGAVMTLILLRQFTQFTSSMIEYVSNSVEYLRGAQPTGRVTRSGHTEYVDPERNRIYAELRQEAFDSSMNLIAKSFRLFGNSAMMFAGMAPLMFAALKLFGWTPGEGVERIIETLGGYYLTSQSDWIRYCGMFRIAGAVSTGSFLLGHLMMRIIRFQRERTIEEAALRRYAPYVDMRDPRSREIAMRTARGTALLALEDREIAEALALNSIPVEAPTVAFIQVARTQKIVVLFLIAWGAYALFQFFVRRYGTQAAIAIMLAPPEEQQAMYERAIADDEKK